MALSVDMAELRKSFLDKSRQFHPDYHTLSSELEQEDALQRSTFNNEAYKTLSDPDRLLAYVLKMKGVLAEESAENKLPPDFLMDMMDLHEKIMALEFDPDPGLFSAVNDLVNSLEQDLETEISHVKAVWNDQPGQEHMLQVAKDYFLKRKYLLRIKENLSKFASAF